MMGAGKGLRGLTTDELKSFWGTYTGKSFYVRLP